MILMCVLWAGVGASPADAPRSPDLGRVSGAVYSTRTGAPLASAKVSLKQIRRRSATRQAPLFFQALTDLDGAFLIGEVPEGEYSVWASKAGYESSRSNSIRVRLRQRENRQKVEIYLRPAAVISGIVKDSFGDPLEKAKVVALRRNYQPGRVSWSQARRGLTNDLGEYRLSGMEAGSYVLAFVPPREPSPRGSLVYEHGAVFYPNLTRPGEGAVLRVAWGQELSGVDVQLPPGSNTLASGFVTNLNGVPVKARVTLVQDGALNVAGFSTNDQGVFVVYGMTPGTYQLTAVARARGGRSSLFGRAEVVVPESGVEGIQLLLSQGQAVSGRVVYEADDKDAAPPGKDPGYFPLLILSDTSLVRSRRLAPFPLPEQDGTFVLSRLYPGRYGLEVERAPEGSYLKAIHWSGQSLAEPVIDVSAGSDVIDLELRMSYGAARLSGTVTLKDGERGAAQPEITIRAFPEKIGGFATNLWAEAAEDGSFQISGLPPGEYSVFAVVRESEVDLWDPAVRWALRSYGTKVHLDSGESATIEVRLVSENPER